MWALHLLQNCIGYVNALMRTSACSASRFSWNACEPTSGER